MKLIIDIDENVFTRLFDCGTEDMIALDSIKACNAIRKGTPIPDNATNGDSVIKMFCKGIVRISSRKNVSVEFNKDWWNAPYQKGGKE